ncbi:MAG: extracellular solute-binding protein, partial [Oscillospiraceae bacterium]|nr:extracellular solute-binding protein [Oscillospiraceae bacterium]
MKKLLCLLLALLCVLSLCGCHGELRSGDRSEANAAEALSADELAALVPLPESFDATKPIEISFWAKNDTNQDQIAIYQGAIRDFQKLYPNVTVRLRLYTDYARIYNDVITNIATDTTPNICISYPDHIATYLTGENVVAPLDGLFVNEKYGLGGSEVKFDSPRREEIVPEFLSECVLSGFTYALPFMRSTEATYVNKTFVEKLGYELPEVLTWDFIWEVSEAAMEKDASGNFKVNGQSVMIPFIYKSTDNMMIQMLRQKGASYSTDDGQVLLFNATTRELLHTIAAHAESRAFSTFKISSYPANFLNAGQCIFAVDSTAGATWIGTDAPHVDIAPDQLVEFETAVYPVPQFDPEHPQMISQGPSVCLFQKDDPQEMLASWLFLQYLISNDVQLPYAETEGYVPVTSKAQQDPAYLDYLSRAGEDAEHYAIKIIASELLMDNTQYTFTTPVFNGSAS